MRILLQLFGKLKGIFNQLYMMPRRGNLHGNNVKTGLFIFNPVALHKLKGNLTDLSLFAGRDGFLGKSETNR